MNSICVTPYFLNRAKRLLKKYATLNQSLRLLQKTLMINPRFGISYGANVYKIRLADESKGKGKSGGFRVITYLVVGSPDAIEIYLITIFDKSEETSITKKEIREIIEEMGLD